MQDFLTLQMPLWAIAVRASAVYLAIVLVFRLIPRRHVGTLSATDVTSLVIVGGLATKSLEVTAESTLDFLLLAAVVLFWGYVFNWLEFRFPWLQRVGQSGATVLVRDGRLMRRNLQRELITEDELMGALRKQGVVELDTIRVAMLEADGQISVVRVEASA